MFVGGFVEVGGAGYGEYVLLRFSILKEHFEWL